MDSPLRRLFAAMGRQRGGGRDFVDIGTQLRSNIGSTLIMRNNRNIGILLVIVLIAVLLRIYTFAGYVGLDDAEYAQLAYRIGKDTFDIRGYQGPGVFPLRVGITFPAALSFKVFGVNEWSMVLYSFIISIISLLLVYVLGRHFFGSRAGLIAASLWCILPTDLLYNATKLLPDLPAAFYASLGLTIILLLIDSSIKNRLTGFVGGICGGVAFGMSWLCKESVVYVLPFCAILLYVTAKKDPRKNIALWLGVALGSGAILLGEMIIYHNLTGDLLFRIHEVQRTQLQMKDGFFTEGSRWGWPQGGSYLKGLMKRLLIVGPQRIFLNVQLLHLPLIGVIASLYAFYWRDKCFLIPSLWLLTLCFMFNFSTSHFSYYAPLALFERYLYPICFPAVILAAGFFNKLCFKEKQNASHGLERERLFWGMVLAVALILIAGYQTVNTIRYAMYPKGWAPEARIISNVLKPSDRVYADILSVKALEFFWGYPEEVGTIDFEDMKLSHEVSNGSFVFVHPVALEWLETNAGMWVGKGPVYNKPNFVANRPSSWKLVWEKNNARLYHVE